MLYTNLYLIYFFALFDHGQCGVYSAIKPVHEVFDEGQRYKPTFYHGNERYNNLIKPIVVPHIANEQSLPRHPLRKGSESSEEKARRQTFDYQPSNVFNSDDDDDDESNGIDSDRFSSFGGNSPSRVRPYKSPGEWATPAPDSGIDLGFTPVQTYIQVRNTNKVEHLPRSEAIKEATSLDEVLNAHRLKEVLRTKKIQEVYSEEGYEDSGYDHGEHERHAEHDEGFAKAKDGKFKAKIPIVSDADDAESMLVLNTNKPTNQPPKVSRKRVEATSMKFSYMDDKVKAKENKKEMVGLGEEMSDDSRPVNLLGKRPKLDNNIKSSRSQTQPSAKHKRAHKYSSQVRDKPDMLQGNLKKGEQLNEKAPPKRDFVSPNGDFWSLPSVFEELARSTKWGSNLQPKAQENKGNQKTGSVKVKIAPKPTFGYIHSLTDSYYGTQTPMILHPPKPIPSHVINLTESLRKGVKEMEESEKVYPGFEPKRLSKRVKRDYEGQENDSEDYEKELSDELDQQEKKIIGGALKNLQGIKGFKEFYSKPGPQVFSFKPTAPPGWKTTYDRYKYPYFNLNGINPYSPLRYASHPREFPKKSGNRMEFYESRDKEVQCDPVSVSLDDVPKSNSTKDLSDQPGKEKRIVGLGDKIQCMKNKYFGEDPLDSPFFKEEELEKLKKPEGIKTRQDERLRYHSTYHYKPNRTMEVLIKERITDVGQKLNDSKEESTQERIKYQELKEENKTQNLRIIPVTENHIQLTTPATIKGMKPPPLIIKPPPFSVIKLPPRPKSTNVKQKLQYGYNCFLPIKKMIVIERADNEREVIYDCKDATFIETVRYGNRHIKIIPKIRRTDLADALLDEDATLRAGEVMDTLLLKRGKRATPSPMPRRKSNLFPNKSLLDRIIKKPTLDMNLQSKRPASLDLGDRSPEEVGVKTALETSVSPENSSTKTRIVPVTTTEATTTTTQQVLKLETKPLGRLSGKDFLDRYHRTKLSKTTAKPSKKEFWKVPVTTSSMKSVVEKKEDIPGNKVEVVSPTPTLLYVVDEATGTGQWIPELVTEMVLPTSTEIKTKSNTQNNERQQKKFDARKKFFAKKSQKS